MKKKQPPRRVMKSIALGTYPGYFLLCIGVPHEKIIKTLRRAGVELSPEDEGIFALDPADEAITAWHGESRTLAIVFRSFDVGNAHNLSVLAHEAMHATKRVMDAVCIPFSDDTNEAYAYQVQHFVRAVIDAAR